MDWGRLWAARGCLGTIFKKVQKITSELQKSDRPTAWFSFFLAAPWGEEVVGVGAKRRLPGFTTTTRAAGASPR